MVRVPNHEVCGDLPILNDNLTDTRSVLSFNKAQHTYTILKTKLLGLDIPSIGIFAQTPYNEYVSLRQRHIGFNMRLRFIVTYQLQQEMNQFINHFRRFEYKPYSHEKLISTKRGSLKKRYQLAYDRLSSGYDADARVKAFIKLEKFTEEKLLTKAPRMIQFRSYEYLYLLSKYLGPIDKWLANCEDLVDGQMIKDYFGKSKDMTAVASQLHSLWSEFQEPVALCMDHSSFDAHVNPDLLMVEHSLYLSNRFIRSKVGNLLNKQYRGKGRTQTGIKYNINGERCSGEYNTSMGNSLINIMILKRCLKQLGIVKHRIVVNGDDSVVIIEFRDLFRIYPNGVFNRQVFQECGMDTKLDKVARIFEDIEFCQCHPVNVNGKFRMIRDPVRTLSRATLMLNDFSLCLDRYLSSLGLCELAFNRGVPILQAFSLALLSLAGCSRPVAKAKQYRAKFEPSLNVEEISYETRASFCQAFGIPIHLQILAEESYRQTINFEIVTKFIAKYKTFHKLN